MAITTAQKKQITNWVNSNEFKPVLNEIINDCLFATDVYFHLPNDNTRSKNIITAEANVFAYLLSYKFPFLSKQSIKNDAELKIYAEKIILKKYGSILEKKINERLKLNNITTDF